MLMLTLQQQLLLPRQKLQAHVLQLRWKQRRLQPPWQPILLVPSTSCNHAPPGVHLAPLVLPPQVTATPPGCKALHHSCRLQPTCTSHPSITNNMNCLFSARCHHQSSTW